MSEQQTGGKRRREKFLPEEDTKLRDLVAKYGTNAWEQVAREMNGRNVRQCRERWKHYLSGDDLKQPWSDYEDHLLFEKMQEIGPKWTKLTQYFPGRTDIQIKTRWMQKFANFSNLHIRNRSKKMPLFVPTTPCFPRQPMYVFMPAKPPPSGQMHVQFPNQVMPFSPAVLPEPPTPEKEQSFFEPPFYDLSFGSRSSLLDMLTSAD